MKITFQKKQLMEAYKILQNAVETRTTREAYKSVYIKADPEHGVILRSTNSLMQVVYYLSADEVEVDSIGTLCVDGLAFNVASQMSDGPIDIHYVDDKVEIRQGERLHSFAAVSLTDYPEQIKFKTWKEYAPGMLIQAFEDTFVSSQQVTIDVIYNSFYINPHPERQYLLTVDGSRFSIVEGFEVEGNLVYLPNAKTMAAMSAIKTLPKEGKLEAVFGESFGNSLWGAFRGYDVTEEKVQRLRWEIGILSLIATEYNEEHIWNAVKAVDNATPALMMEVNLAHLKTIIETCNLYKGQAATDQSIEIVCKNGQVSVEMSIPQLAEVNEPLETLQPIDTVDAVNVLVDPILLAEVLRLINAERIMILVYTQPQVLMIRNPDFPGYRYIQATSVKRETLAPPEVPETEEPENTEPDSPLEEAREEAMAEEWQ